MIGNMTLGLSTLYQRRLALITKTPKGIFAPMATSVLFALVVAPALAEALGSFNPDIDYMTYVVVEGTNPGLAAIWHMGSDVLMAGLSLAVLAAYAFAMLAAAVQVFHRRTMA